MVTVRVKLTPRASDTRLVRFDAGVLYARVAAAPVDGAANRALTDLLTGALRRRKSAVRIVAGESCRHKLVEIEGVDANELERLLRDTLNESAAR